MPKALQIRTSALHQYDALMLEKGMDSTPFLTQLGLTPDSLSSERQTMLLQDFVALLNASAVAAACPHFGLLLGARQSFEMLGPLGILLENCQTTREAATALSALMTFHNQSEYWDFQAFEAATVIQRFDLYVPENEVRQYRELAISACFHLCKRLFGKSFKPVRVTFTHEPNGNKSAYTQCFGVPVLFNQEQDAVVLEAGALDVQLQAGDNTLKEAKKRYLASLQREFAWDIEQQVAILIQQTLLVQEAGMTQIAALLRMQPRTLQRRLAKAGTQFRTVLNNTRHHMACHYLTVSSMPVTQIARLLGYQELANFSRAFKARSGVYPTLYRQKQTERH